MPTTTTLRGSPVREPLVGSNLTVFAPGYRGEVVQLDPTAHGSRAAGDPLPLVEAAASADVYVVSRLLVRLDAPLAAPDGQSRGAVAALPKLIVPKRAGVEYAVLETAEDGTSRWVLPAVTREAEAAFELTTAAHESLSSGGRGPVTAGMRGIVRVVAWAAQPVLEKGALAVARGWEGSKRPHAWRQVTRDGRFVMPDWSTLAAGPVLLLVHGTFSTPEAAFNGWVGSHAFAAVAARYADRCLAFAHPSLSASPDDNVEWMLAQIPATLKGPVDVVCHSRGGLVARGIAANPRLAVRRICQVGTPNLGTPLADAQRLMAFLDGHTALLTHLPDSVSTIVLEGLLCLVKLAATGAGHGLPGLVAMEPEGDYLKALGQRPLGAQQWFTIGADFQPSALLTSRLALRATDKLVDRFFASPNDLVVPADGCHVPGAPVAESLRIAGGTVHHTNYFIDASVHGHLNTWLQ